MFTSSSHNVPNDFSWCSQYVLHVPIVFPNTFPRALLSHMVWQMLSFFHLSILLSKVVWFALRHWDLRNHHVLDCILGIFGMLFMSNVHWHGLIVFGLTMRAPLFAPITFVQKHGLVLYISRLEESSFLFYSTGIIVKSFI